MKNKVAKIIFGVILLGAIIIPSFGGVNTTIGNGRITTLGYDTPNPGN
ncbi:hypothetical protein JHL18_07765 [Clostridium sp. YIM B02505]|uniref:Phr family secreted Rap phosphatase inhibitor n=1 Tax=Clostridium yunnanense TaxID=2800325 RepID=A0ABS1EME8_9CLOT|nr:hypothetical protein [Clostridium yunnanense]MBK1810530.1 hypothetical protein [Clostridium yunnanense]